MKVVYEAAFLRDLKRVRSKKVRRRVQQVIEEVKKASAPHEILGLTKLRGYETFYRIRVGDYRIGIEIVDDTVIFVRFLHRRDIYRYFP
ncbi:MAG: type II toxin-antitoxin system RelE/ParE family toxin [Candidatus Latescibacterota bacterium]|nr:MAG: type II toxin-antitoxin system RelE/ParE family toxin [Candidatus Latescibacterota bacterium]